MEIIGNIARSTQSIKLANTHIQQIENGQAHGGKSFKPTDIEITKSSFDPTGAEIRVRGLLVRKDGLVGHNAGYALYKVGDVSVSNALPAPAWLQEVLESATDLVVMTAP